MNKLLALLQILIKETDENHKLTTNQLIEKLSEQGVYAHRNTIPSDIEKLRNEKARQEKEEQQRAEETQATILSAIKVRRINILWAAGAWSFRR